MRKFFLLVVGLLFASSLLKAAGMLYVSTAEPTTSTVATSGQTAKVFLSLTPVKVQEITGKKMSFYQKISLKLAQLKVKRQLNKGKVFDMNSLAKSGDGDTRKFHWSSIVALCCGVIAFFVGYTGVPAIVFGAIGISKTGPNKKYKGLGFSIAGLAVGALGFLLALAILATL